VSYTIVRTDGTVLTTIPDGIVNTTSTPLSLPGRNYPGYGQVMDTNFVRALENFADTTVPANPIRGQLFYNTSTETLYICPTDGESTLANWYKIWADPLANLVIDNLDLADDLTANNAFITNDITANSVTANYLAVNTNATIAAANITGVARAGQVNTTSMTTGSNSTLGNIVGAWSINGAGTVNGISDTSLWVTGGNLVVTGAGNIGIRTDNYKWANGNPVSFEGTYTNTNVSLYMPTYQGNVGYPGSSSAFNGNVLSTGSNLIQGTIVGNWHVSPGSSINGLSNIAGANVTGIVGNALISQFANTANIANVVTVNAQPNITSVGTLTGLGVAGDITAANITSNTGIFAGNAAGLFNIPIANLVGTFPTVGNATNASQADVANTVSVNSQPNITSVGTLTGLIVSGNAQFTGPVVSLGSNGNVRINGGTNGQVLITNGSGGLSWADTGSANTALTVINNAQPNITSLGSLTGLTVSGDITTGNLFANSGTIRASSLVGTISNSSQTNITTLGTLTGLSVGGNANFASPVVNLGPVSNVRITSGSSGQVLTTNGAGVLSWEDVTNATTAGTVTTNAQPNITSTGTLTSLGVSGGISVTGTGTFGNITTSGIAATGVINFTGPNVSLGAVGNVRITGGSSGQVLSTDGSGGLSWVSAAAATTAITVTANAQPNVTSLGTLTGLSVNGNITVTTGRYIGNAAGLTNIPGANVTGVVPVASYSTTSGTASTATTATTAGAASTATTAGTANLANIVIGSAQPNITSLGTLTSLAVSGAITKDGQNVISLGDFTTSTGYTVLPNGLILQFGTGTCQQQRGTTVFYPVSFTTTPIFVASGSSGSTADGRQGGILTRTVGTSSASVFYSTFEGSTFNSFWWIAVGY
jgi:hypothetical protein